MTSKTFLFLLILISFSLTQISFAKIQSGNNYYLSPKPGSKSANAAHSIAFRSGEIFTQQDLEAISFEIIGDKSGKIDGKIKLAADSKTIIISPEKNFQNGETVTVKMMNINGAENIEYQFETLENPIFYDAQNQKYPSELFPKENRAPVEKNETLQEEEPRFPTPEMIVYDKEKLAEGYYFFSPWNPPAWLQSETNIYPVLMIMDNNGTIVYHKSMYNGEEYNHMFDFKVQEETGNLSYFSHFNANYQIIDKNFEFVREIQADNEYTTDLHGLQVLPEGHSTVMSYPVTNIDMSELVEGGHPNARIIYAVFQELDADGNAIFEWNSLDYIPVTDATPNRYNMKEDSVFDYIHINSVDVDTDTSYIFSSRHLDQVVRVSKNTGDIIWRMGLGPNDDITRISEVDGQPPDFSAQHDARWHGNGRITLFDNSNLNSLHASRGLEFIIDEENKTAKMVKVFINDTSTFGPAMGNYQILDNGNRIMGYGMGTPDMTEFDEDGATLCHIQFEGVNYRAFKFDWKPTALVSDAEKIILDEENTISEILITNNTSKTLTLNKFLFENPEIFEVKENELQLSPEESGKLTIEFYVPEETITVNDILTACSDTDSTRISVQVAIEAENIIESVEETFKEIDRLNIYPQPAADHVYFEFENNDALDASLEIIDLSGNSVYEIPRKIIPSGKSREFLNTNNFAPGLYIVKITSNGKVSSKTFRIVR